MSTQLNVFSQSYLIRRNFLYISHALTALSQCYKKQFLLFCAEGNTVCKFKAKTLRMGYRLHIGFFLKFWRHVT